MSDDDKISTSQEASYPTADESHVEDQVQAGGEEGRHNADATPPIGEQDSKGQTQHEAPADDAGGARDEPDRTE